MPGGKAAHIAALEASGRKVLMIGNGLNDAPVLAAAHASMAPASAADVGCNAADLVFLRESLPAVPLAISVAKGRPASPAELCHGRRIQPSGQDDAGRVYARLGESDRIWMVLVSHKSEQSRDIAWLARQ